MKTIRIGGPGSRRIKDLGETAQYPGLCDHLLLWYNGSVQSKFPRETEYQLILECEIEYESSAQEYRFASSFNWAATN